MLSVNNRNRLATALICASIAFAGCSKMADPGQPTQQPAAQTAAEPAQSAEAWQKDMDRLKALGAAYHARIDSTGSGPASWADVKQAGNPAVFQELESEGWVVAWGKHFRDAAQGTSQFVLAYSPRGLEADSFVLFMDGAVSRIPADELKAKLAAQGSPAAAP